MPDQLEHWIGHCVKPLPHARLEETPFYKQVMNGTYKLGDIDFLVWKKDEQQKTVYCIEAKLWYDGNNPEHNEVRLAQPKAHKDLVNKSLNAFLLLSNKQTASTIWKNDIKPIKQSDRNWNWALIFLIEINPSIPIHEIQEFQDKVRTAILETTLPFVGHTRRFSDKAFNRIFVMTPKMAHKFMPDVFPQPFAPTP